MGAESERLEGGKAQENAPATQAALPDPQSSPQKPLPEDSSLWHRWVEQGLLQAEIVPVLLVALIVVLLIAVLLQALLLRRRLERFQHAIQGERSVSLTSLGTAFRELIDGMASRERDINSMKESFRRMESVLKKNVHQSSFTRTVFEEPSIQSGITSGVADARGAEARVRPESHPKPEADYVRTLVASYNRALEDGTLDSEFADSYDPITVNDLEVPGVRDLFKKFALNEESIWLVRRPHNDGFYLLPSRIAVDADGFLLRKMTLAVSRFGRIFNVDISANQKFQLVKPAILDTRTGPEPQLGKGEMLVPR
jgi:hypothetical protein